MNWNLGELEVTQDLVEQGANIAAKTNKKWTPLHYSAANGSWNYLSFEKKYIDKPTNKSELVHNLDHFEVTKYLVEKGADIEAKTNIKSTPLHLSSQNGNLKYFRMGKNGDKLMKMNWIGIQDTWKSCDTSSKTELISKPNRRIIKLPYTCHLKKVIELFDIWSSSE